MKRREESMEKFELKAPWKPAGDQPQAIDKLVVGLKEGMKYQTLLGVTGSGKTFTIANVIKQVQRPVLVIAHNKTLAAQLYSEFKDFFPNNEVHYFVSYYDYYQPEAYLPAQDIYIEKDASINERIEKLRLATTKALLERRDVIVVASVSCIYGLGKRKSYEEAIFRFSVGDVISRKEFFKRLLDNYYERNDVTLEPGTFRGRGDVVEVYPAYSDTALRISFFDDEIERIEEIDPLWGKSIIQKDHAAIFPAQHYVTTQENIQRALKAIEEELERRVAELQGEGKVLEAQRLLTRTRYDMQMLAEVGYCSGIENYSRHLDGRNPGEPPGTLLDFFPDDFIMVIDESHITVPQIRGMYNGDISRKKTLVEHGFRLPSCLDNRPLRWEEFEEYMKQVIFISATPGDYEISVSSQVVEQLIRPTGILDPEVEVVPARNQLDDLLHRLKECVGANQRVLVNTLTKRSAEDLAEYLAGLGYKVRYIHSELDAFERAELLRDLRIGNIDILVGVNLLREGLDLPEVRLVAILDADREGFLRSSRSIIQMIGRAARHAAGTVVLYADEMTEGIEFAVRETKRRREAQEAFNLKHGVIPKSIVKPIVHLLPEELLEHKLEEADKGMLPRQSEVSLDELERMMWDAVSKLNFEEAARLRDLISDIKGGKITRGTIHNRKRSKTA
ncbi:MAG TPA: excinuclease ABC subunit UvrB [Acetomicrobium flavidum]|uniref:excinuclease ABC subunit UvrB n=1 Tax=Acetomicrobium flavidum TaxID=49896 RepID=UPI002BB5BE36|nr:excinuclease ABC subunit UvrB [Acetomicrobium flavidum]HOM30851.1 excinuclease ABC subunit UvrB [Acetomicrobium flavidum]HPP14059.1 excinuclease ABC subunit UvrB [Acetomicrobium flavidum]